MVTMVVVVMVTMMVIVMSMMMIMVVTISMVMSGSSECNDCAHANYQQNNAGDHSSFEFMYLVW